MLVLKLIQISKMSEIGLQKTTTNKNKREQSVPSNL